MRQLMLSFLLFEGILTRIGISEKENSVYLVVSATDVEEKDASNHVAADLMEIVTGASHTSLKYPITYDTPLHCNHI